jgi:multidrug resistance efflux pump
MGRIGKERGDVAHAEADLAALRQQYDSMAAEVEQEVAALEGSFDPASIQVERVAVRPRKSDIAVSDLALVWQPA